MNNWLTPHPETLGTRIDGWTNPKTIATIEQHSIKEIGFASSVHSSDGDNCNFSGNCGKNGLGFLPEAVF